MTALGCATLTKAACYAVLEPSCSGIDYGVRIGQAQANSESAPVSERESQTGGARHSVSSGMMPGPGIMFKALPPVGLPQASQIPEGYYAPPVAAAVRRGEIKVPPGFVDLRSLGFLSDGNTFSVAHETVRESPDRQLEEAMQLSGPGHPYWTKQDAQHLVGRTEGLRRVLDFSTSSAEVVKTKRLAAVRNSFGRGLAYLVPFIEFDRGVRAEWVINLKNDGTSSISCRADVSDLSANLPASTPVMLHEELERRILTRELSLEGEVIYPSRERSKENPERPAQVAAMLWKDLPPEFFTLLGEQGILRSKLRLVNERMQELDAKCLYRRNGDADFNRLCSQLAVLDREYRALNSGISDYDRRLREASPDVLPAKLEGMFRLVAMLSPFIVSREKMRLYVRFDFASQRMQVIAVLDKPNMLWSAAGG